MEDLEQGLTNGLDNLLDILAHAAFWKLGAGLVLGTALLVFIAGLPEEYRSSARLVAVIALGLTVLCTALGVMDWREMLG